MRRFLSCRTMLDPTGFPSPLPPTSVVTTTGSIAIAALSDGLKQHGASPIQPAATVGASRGGRMAGRAIQPSAETTTLTSVTPRKPYFFLTIPSCFQKSSALL
jgi:hypothetical protein